MEKECDLIISNISDTYFGADSVIAISKAETLLRLFSCSV